jgi:4-hydroxy-2-oxoheptanedioate aldolase
MTVSSDSGMLAYRAPSLFQPHRLRQAIRDAHAGKIPPLMGYFFALTSIPTSRFIAPLGFDIVWIDWEHAAVDVETITTVSKTYSKLLTTPGGP